MSLEKCDDLSSSSGNTGAGGSIVGGGKRTKMQSASKSRVHGSQHCAAVIDKQKFYTTDQLTRPPLRSRTRRNIRNHQPCKLTLVW